MHIIVTITIKNINNHKEHVFSTKNKYKYSQPINKYKSL